MTKKTDIKVEEDEAFKLTAAKRQPLNFEKAQLMFVNSMWKSQFEKMQSKDVRVALLGAGQSFGEEELITDNEFRQSKATVKSQVADLLVISLEVKKIFYLKNSFFLKKFIENAYDPDNFFDSLCNNNSKMKWRKNFSSKLADANLQKEIQQTKNEKKPRLQNRGYVPIHGLEGTLKAEQKRFQLSSLNEMPASPKIPAGLKSPKITSPKASFTIKTNTPRGITERSDLNSQRAPITPKAKNNEDTTTTNPDETPTAATVKSHRRVMSHGGVKGLNAFVTTYQSPVSPKRKDSLVSGSKLWESNICHYQNIIRKQKSRESSALMQALKSNTVQNSFENSPHNNNSLFKSDRAGLQTPKSSFLKDNSATFKGPASDFGEDEIQNTRARPTTASMYAQNISSLHMGRNSSAEHLDSKKLLAKKLGVDKLFITQSPMKDPIKIPLQLYINSPADPHVLSTTTRSPTSAKEALNVNSFSSVIGKINSTVNTSHMSPLLVRRIKSQIVNNDLMDSFSPMSTPKSKGTLTLTTSPPEKHSRSGSRDSVKRLPKF